MNKKQQRVKYLIGCRQALNTNGKAGPDGKMAYDLSLIKQIISTLDETLKLDNITPMNADSKFGEQQ